MRQIESGEGRPRRERKQTKRFNEDERILGRRQKRRQRREGKRVGAKTKGIRKKGKK